MSLSPNFVNYSSDRVPGAGVTAVLGPTNTGKTHLAIEQPERLPVTDVHKRNVVDPMTGSMLRVGGTADPVNRDACNAKFSVFDGRMRYDLQFEYKRIDVAKPEKGYRGPVVVCALYFSPVAGYIPNRPTIKYLAAQRNMEVWFAPVAGTRVLVPYKIVVPTAYGTAALEAMQFVSTPAPSKAALRTQ